GTDPAARSSIGLDYMTYDELERFGHEVDDVRQRVLADLGQPDANYIRRVIRAHHIFEVLGRIGIFCPFFSPVFIAGSVVLAQAKINDNMETGDIVMHDKYDWMNDQKDDGHKYEWDNVAPAKEWKHGHNYKHHTNSNDHGMVRDIGFNL